MKDATAGFDSVVEYRTISLFSPLLVPLKTRCHKTSVVRELVQANLTAGFSPPPRFFGSSVGKCLEDLS